MDAVKELNSLRPQQLDALLSVYDTRNISALINRLPEEERETAVESMLMEAMARHRDPAMGSLGTIFSLIQKIQILRGQVIQTQHALTSLQSPSHQVDNIDTQEILEDKDYDDA